MNIKVPTRTVTSSGTGSYQRTVSLSGRWQEHTNSSTIPVTGATSLQNITGTWGYNGSGTSANQFEVVAFPGTTPSMTIRPWTWRYTITANHYVKSATVADRGNLPSNVNARCQVSKNTIELIISGGRGVTATPTDVEIHYTTYTEDMWQAIGSITFDPGYDNVEITNLIITDTGGASTVRTNFVGNRVFMDFKAYTEKTGSVTGQVRITYNYDTTTTTSYWTASDSYSVNWSQGNATVTSASFVSGTRPTFSYSGDTVYANWTTYSEPSSTYATASVTVIFDAPYTDTHTYANVYFNGTRVNYVYFNGTRYP